MSRTLKPRSIKRKKRSRKSKKSGPERSFPKKVVRVVFALIWIWTYKLTIGMWNAYNHEDKWKLYLARTFMAIAVIPFLWLGAFAIYVAYVIPAMMWGGTAIIIWGNTRIAKKLADATGTTPRWRK